MKKLFTLILIFLISFIAGCITDSGGDSDSEKNNGDLGDETFVAEEYFPISDIESLTFENTEVWSDGSKKTYTHTLTISGTQSINGKTFVVLSDPYENQDYYFRIENNMVYMYDSEEKMEYIWMDFNAKEGDIWNISEYSEQYEGGSVSISHKGKFFGTESVTVPSGTFNNCIISQLTYQSINSKSGGDLESKVDTQTIWFAKGVGPVKVVDSEQENGVVVHTTTSLLINNEDSVSELEGNWEGSDSSDSENPGGTAVLILSGSNFDLTASEKSEWYKGTYTINKSVVPKQVDFNIIESSESQFVGKTSLCIYKIEGNILTITANGPGDTTRPSSFSSEESRVMILTKQ